MARMKIEFLHHYNKRHGLTLRQKLIAWLPRYAPIASKFAPLLNLRDAIPGLPLLTEKLFGLSARRTLPRWRSGFSFTPSPPSGGEGTADTAFGERSGAGGGAKARYQQTADSVGNESTRRGKVGEVVLLVDTFNRYFEPENVHAALDVLEAAGYKVEIAAARGGGRPLCCGRTFLAAGLVDEARVEAQRMLDALRPFVDRGVPIVGLEPSCLLTLRDEFLVMGLDGEIGPTAERALLFEEFLADEADAGRLKLDLAPLRAQTALLHGHCHQKAFDAMPAVSKVLGMIPGLKVQTVDSGCCGMAGSFGYEAEHFAVSMKMAEQTLLPAVRKAGPDTIIVADGTSCRHQIHGGARKNALHVARVLQMSLEERKQ
jgi:Fe-S oxidoreductase